MTTGFRIASGTDFDNVFDPYVQGTKPGATGYRTSDGVDLNQRFAPIVFGSAAAATGLRLSGGADVNTLWAAKGTANYALPFDGQNFASNAGARGHAQLDLNMMSDGTYTIVRSGTSIATSTLASGSWLPGGGSVANYAVQFTISQSGSTSGGGTNSTTNGATTQSALTTTRILSAMSDASLTGDLASADAVCTAKLYKSGVLVSTTTFNFHTNANGH